MAAACCGEVGPTQEGPVAGKGNPLDESLELAQGAHLINYIARRRVCRHDRVPVSQYRRASGFSQNSPRARPDSHSTDAMPVVVVPATYRPPRLHAAEPLHRVLKKPTQGISIARRQRGDQPRDAVVQPITPGGSVSAAALRRAGALCIRLRLARCGAPPEEHVEGSVERGTVTGVLWSRSSCLW